MRVGITLRTMGPQAAPETLLACARVAEQAGFDDLWVPDHIAIPPDDAEGSEGIYLDPLTALASLAAVTSRIGLGTAVLVLPYRAALPTIKQVASIQELSGGRLQLGVGVGWMEPEFRALGVDRRRRGAITDETLALLHDCFAADVVERNGQRFLFRPRPARPPILVGGAPPHALERTVRWGDGWLPMGSDAARLAPAARELRRLADAAGKPPPRVVVLTGLRPDDAEGALERARALAAAGATELICGTRYRDVDGFRALAEGLARLLPALREI